MLEKLRVARPGSKFRAIYDGRDYGSRVEDDCKIESIEKADSLIFESMCASILSKATHDVFINEACKNAEYQKYGIEHHRGYGTPKHRVALKGFGLTDEHRIGACKTLLGKPDANQPAGRGRRTDTGGDHTDGRITERRVRGTA